MDKKESPKTNGETILVSACLLGLPTRYDGKSKRSQQVLEYLQGENLTPIPVCPEQLAGMTTPRDKTFFLSGDGRAVLAGKGEAVSENGLSMNAVFCHGAKLTLEIARLSSCRRALLKEGSPSCGVHRVYLGEDKVAGVGVTSALLINSGLDVISEEDLK
ncbi:DUF523 domain-containing protein [Deltaproteobacteria bacterium IMCC39524]|nr:DUF523 domain-containing protein [Deltaproteobacteria bacterium IMCC39524]